MNIKLLKESKQQGNFIFSTYKIYGIKQGFGNTICNSLRRTIISSTPGLSISGFKISCFKHEFDKSSIIVEDTGEIMYKMKEVEIFYDPSVNYHTINVEIQGPIVFTAGMLETEQIKIVNKDFVLFNLSENKKINLSVFIDHGTGFTIHTDNVKKFIGKDHFIAITSFYSRIEKVNYKVEIDEISSEKEEICTIDIVHSNCYEEHFIFNNSLQSVISTFNDILDAFNVKEDETIEKDSFGLLMNSLQHIIEEEIFEKICTLTFSTSSELILLLEDTKIQKQLEIKKKQAQGLIDKIKEIFPEDET